MDEMPGMIRPDLQALPQVKDRMIFLYLEHCTLGRQDGAITVTDEKRGGLHPGGGHLGAAAGAGHACLYGITPAYAGVILASSFSKISIILFPAYAG